MLRLSLHVWMCSMAVAVSAVAMAADGPAKASAAVSTETSQRIAERLRTTFRSFQFDDVRLSELPGIYEVYSNGRIIYYAPEQDLLIFGELYRTDGKSLTAEKLAGLQNQRAGSIDRSVATVVGEGDTEVIAFVDPDCGYCRKADEWLQQDQRLSKLKLLVYFMPMSGRPEAQARAEALICAPPALRTAALSTLFTRKAEATPLHCDGAAQQLAGQAREAMRFGVTGTPTFVVSGQAVQGFDPNRLTQLLALK